MSTDTKDAKAAEPKKDDKSAPKAESKDKDAKNGSTTTSSGTSTKKVTRRVIETVEESEDSTSLREHYRPTIASKNIIIQRNSANLGAGRPQVGVERSVRYSMTSAPPVGGSLALIQKAGMTEVSTSRIHEKKEMQDLNERLANYIEKVRFLEAENKKLADDLKSLKDKWGHETRAVKVMFEAELDEARRLLDDANREKGRLEVRVASLEEMLLELRQRAEDAEKAAAEERGRNEKANQKMSDMEAECNLLRRQFHTMEADRDKDRKRIQQLNELLQAARTDLNNVTLSFVDAESRRQSLEEELEFLKTLHDQEMKELAALAYRDTTAENREYWKSEMGQALREIQQAYEDKMDTVRGEMESFYNLKVQEVRTGATQQNVEAVHAREDSKRLRGQMTTLRDKLADLDAKNAQLQMALEALRREKDDIERRLGLENTELKDEVVKLRAEMEAIIKELSQISDTKLGLELEIAAYRKLLEGEESRVGLRQLVDMISGGSADSSKVSQVVKGEMSAKTTYQRSAKGPVAIAEISSDGKFLIIENTSTKEESIGEWQINRDIDGKEKVSFTLPKSVVLKAGEKLKIWSKGAKPADAGKTDLECDKAWGVGSDITTKLCNATKEDRATHVQKTTFA